MPSNKLTAKQELFCQAIADGKDQATAYRTAYDADNMKDESVYPQASKLMKDPKIAIRVSELKAEVAEKQLWTREMSVLGLMKAFEVAEREKQAAGMTGAVKELNIMHGFNEPTKLTVDMKFKPITDEDWL
jgi:phage terminase small subunit